MKNRGGGLFSYIFGKRMTSAEVRHRRLSAIPGTTENKERQQKRRETKLDIASPETRTRRREALPGTEENIARQRAKAADSRRLTRRSKSK